MPVLPGSNYIGPGNTLNSGNPTNQFDLIAFSHDNQYNNAESESDIIQADKEFLKSAYESVPFNALESVHKYVSLFGIGVKYNIESLTGVLYPKLQVWLIIENEFTLLHNGE